MELTFSIFLISLFLVILALIFRKLNLYSNNKNIINRYDGNSLQIFQKKFYTSFTGYKLLMKTWNKDSKLHEEKELNANMGNLLGIHHYISNHPEIKSIEIKRPIFIISWLRTGSTFLHELLALDTRNCIPYVWETFHPLTLSNSSDLNSDINQRKALARQDIEHYYAGEFKDFRNIHDFCAEDPAQCKKMFERCSINRRNLLMGQNMEEYTEWFLSLKNDQIDEIYELYKLELQYHMFCKRKREIGRKQSEDQQWCLKDEIHMYFLESLLKTFPDAIILNLHRNPIHVLGSIVSANHFTMKKLYMRTVINGDQLAQRCLQQMIICKNRFMKVRSRVMELTGRTELDVFIDVKFQELCCDSKNVIGAIYDRLGKECTEEHFSKITQYLSKSEISSNSMAIIRRTK